MTTIYWNAVYTKLREENERQIRYYQTLTWLAPSVCLALAGVLWLIPLKETKFFAYPLMLASVFLVVTNSWICLRYKTRPLTIVEGTVHKKLTERDGQKGSTAKKYFLRLRPFTVYELTPQGQGVMRSSGKTKNVQCSKELSAGIAEGSVVRLQVLSGGFAMGYIENEEAIYPPFAVSFVQLVLSTFVQRQLLQRQ